MSVSRAKTLCSVILFILLSPVVYGQLTDHQFILSKNVQVSHSEIDNGYTRFTPTIKDIQRADSVSKDYIKAHRDKYPWTKEIINYDQHYRQYVGYLNLNHQKTIFVNGFCRPETKADESLVDVRGGGSCFFNIKVDLSSKKAFNLNVNAPR